MRPKKSILCVDDNEQVLSVRGYTLWTRGFRVIPASGGKQALAILAGCAPGSVDLLLTDLMMPGMDGNELAREAKIIHPGIPVLIVSGIATNYDRCCHCDVFMPKGANSPAELLERCRILCARKRGPKKAVPVYLEEAASA